MTDLAPSSFSRLILDPNKPIQAPARKARIGPAFQLR
jgi:hypothetical protein